ncbi:MAG: hypothetical protein AABX03_02405 [Nanoarchaeota archaeon]
MVSKLEMKFIEGQEPWMRDHHYFMIIQMGRDVERNEAALDYLRGNDRISLGEDPSPEFKDHLSPRELTWEKEYTITFWNTIIKPGLEAGEFSDREDLRFIESKRRDMEKRDLLIYPHLQNLAIA